MRVDDISINPMGPWRFEFGWSIKTWRLWGIHVCRRDVKLIVRVQRVAFVIADVDWKCVLRGKMCLWTGWEMRMRRCQGL
jgi:hypothetical protein